MAFIRKFMNALINSKDWLQQYLDDKGKEKTPAEIKLDRLKKGKPLNSKPAESLDN